MDTISELKAAWRPLCAAMLGLATGNSVLGTITSAIAPTLLADTGWSKADFALIGSVSLVGALVLPLIGWLADRIGVRMTALIGLVCLPLVYLAYSFSGGSLLQYTAVYLFQVTVCVTTTAMVYTRLIVQNVVRARGLALAVVASSPALASALGGPFLSEFTELHGWQQTYRALALLFAVTGVITFLLLPADNTTSAGEGRRSARGGNVYRALLAMPAFWIIAGAMLLCNLPQALLLSQLKLLVFDQGITGGQAAMMFTAVSAGTLAGRIVTGLALDRFPAHLVAFFALAVPGLGLFVLATPLDWFPLVMASIFFLGFAFGAEGDVVAYLIARFFALETYSSVMGLMTAVMAFSSALGAVLLSAVLARTGGYVPFLLGTGLAVMAGAALLLRLGRCTPASSGLPD